ncbi:uncharacterized protein LOC117588508 [Drosophila guanche]|uniref:Protein TsetseEP domain-containing protein n=1 Tax=Drosophila guanche TaxID=7266 RepID=A0A3B0JX54_DROGU|nr:uncharacterized protein LOC117588508 [Drosophila guanche]SPP86634.1 Hypothetical predicted protein [Drosophila guanche]
MKRIILVLALALAAAVSAINLEERFHDVEADIDVGMDTDMDIDMDFAMDFAIDFAKELDLSEDVEIDQFGLVDKMVHAAISEAEYLAGGIVKMVEHQLLQIFLSPFKKLEQAATDIKNRAVDSEACVSNEAVHVATTLESATLGFLNCGRDATVTSVNLILDTKRAVVQLTFDGYSLIRQVQSCRKTTLSWLRKMCRTRLYINGCIYAVNAQRSIRHLIALRRTVPAVATDATSCTSSATENALFGFAEINANIDTCIDTMIH